MALLNKQSKYTAAFKLSIYLLLKKLNLDFGKIILLTVSLVILAHIPVALLTNIPLFKFSLFLTVALNNFKSQ